MRLVRLPSSGGIVPVRMLLERYSPLRLVRLPSFGRDRTREPVRCSEFAGEIDAHDPPGNVHIHSVPVLERRVGQPVLVVDPVGAVGGFVERDERRPVRALDHRDLGCPARIADRRRDRHRAFDHGRHQSRGAYGRHRGVTARPRHARARHRLSVLVEHLCRKLNRCAQGRELGGGGTDCHGGRPGWIGWRGGGFGASVPAGPQRGDREDKESRLGYHGEESLDEVGYQPCRAD